MSNGKGKESQNGDLEASNDLKSNKKSILGVKVDRNEKGEAIVTLSLGLILTSVGTLVVGTATLIFFYTSFVQEVKNVGDKINSLSENQKEMFDISANNFKELEVATQILLERAGSSRSLNLETLTLSPITPIDTINK